MKIFWMLKNGSRIKRQNDNAWRVDVSDIKEFNLDSRNPNDVDDHMVLPPHDLVGSYIDIRKRMIGIFEDVERIISQEVPK